MRRWWVTILIALATGSIVQAQSAEATLRGAHILGRGDHLYITATMWIHERGSTQERGLEVFFDTDDGASYVLARITSPGFLRNMKFLSHIDSDGDRSQWMRTSRGTRRLAAGNGDERVFNSHFTADDFSVPDFGAGAVRFVEDTAATARLSIDGEFAIVEVDEPRPGEFDRRVFVVDRASDLLVAIDYYDGDRLVRGYTVLDARQIDGVTYPARAQMSIEGTDDSTEIHFDTIEPGYPIPSRTFNPAAL